MLALGIIALLVGGLVFSRGYASLMKKAAEEFHIADKKELVNEPLAILGTILMLIGIVLMNF